MNSRIERLERLGQLKVKGALTEAEFLAEKARVLESDQPTFASSEDASLAPEVLAPQAEGDEAAKGRKYPTVLKWLIWGFIAVVAVVILAKFATVIALITAIAGAMAHIYANSEKSSDLRKAAFIAYGAAILILIGGRLVNRILPRPSDSELTVDQFFDLCRDKKDTFENKCDGKFVRWDGVASGDDLFLDDNAIRVQLKSSGGAIDLYGTGLNHDEVFEGMRIQFSGYLTKKNAFFDDITDGKIEKNLNTKAQIDSENQAKEAAKDNLSAARMGVGIALYKKADEMENLAGVECQSAAKAYASYDGASSDFFPNREWRVTEDNLIHISGHDLSMKNGFGVGRHVNYYCDFNMDTKNAIITSIN